MKKALWIIAFIVCALTCLMVSDYKASSAKAKKELWYDGSYEKDSYTVIDFFDLKGVSYNNRENIFFFNKMNNQQWYMATYDACFRRKTCVIPQVAMFDGVPVKVNGIALLPNADTIYYCPETIDYMYEGAVMYLDRKMQHGTIKRRYRDITIYVNNKCVERFRSLLFTNCCKYKKILKHITVRGYGL